MLEVISFFIFGATAIAAFRFLIAKNSYEKIAGFCFVFTGLTITVLTASVSNFSSMLDIITILFLLQLVAVLFLLSDKKS